LAGFSDMLTATRDPSLQNGAVQPVGLGFSRLMIGLQVAGGLLAIPAGLASAWSIYHANFSTEARCQSLRANIVSMLDKSADATTLRMLIGRDVATFEQSCGAVDPDAVAAFKTLLAGDKSAPAAAAKPPARQAVTKATEVKPAAVGPAPREGADAKWLGAVREALTSHHAEPQPAAVPVAAVPSPPPVATPVQAIAVPITPVAAPAPALPVAAVPAVPVAAAPAAAADHPVPPALVPEASPPVEARAGLHLGALVAHLPLIRRMFDR
jgi:hypothetical protein